MFNVDSSYLNLTNCDHNYSCLTEKKCGNRDMCDVHFASIEFILVLHNKEDAKCKFRMNFGDGKVCKCPTHYGIYQNYKQ